MAYPRSRRTSAQGGRGGTPTPHRYDDRAGRFDPSVGFVRPRLAGGAFLTPYDPAGSDPLSGQGFAEGNGSQYTWMVPQDPAGLIAALGGPAAAGVRLDRFFEHLNAGNASPYAFLGNEPNSNAPYIYNWLGRPWRTQELMRRAILTLFDSTPGGFPGNDDLGQMSAWYVFGALGLYPAIPGTDVLALGSPLFPHVVIRRPRGDITITAPRAHRDAPYVHRLSVNSRRSTRSWLRLADVGRGGRLAFGLSRRADRAWGAGASALPPSFGPLAGRSCDVRRTPRRR